MQCCFATILQSHTVDMHWWLFWQWNCKWSEESGCKKDWSLSENQVSTLTWLPRNLWESAVEVVKMTWDKKFKGPAWLLHDFAHLLKWSSWVLFHVLPTIVPSLWNSVGNTACGGPMAQLTRRHMLPFEQWLILLDWFLHSANLCSHLCFF